MTTRATRCWFDGALDPDGRAAFGFLIARDERVIVTCSSLLETCPGMDGIDSIATEFAALDTLLRYLIVAETRGPITICGDCAPVISVVCGYSRICDRYQQQADRIMSTLMLLPPVRFEWIPRSLNHRAHNLARAGLKNHQTVQLWANACSKPINNGSTNETGNGNGNGNGNRKTKPEKNGQNRRGAKVRRKARQLLTRIIDRL